VSFKIPRAVLALPIGLIDRLGIDERASRAGALVVRVDIIHVHERPEFATSEASGELS